jgi:hypothetical protein
VFYRILKHGLGSAEAAPGIQQTIDLRSVPCPFLDHVEVAHVQRVGGVFVVRIGHGSSIAALDGMRGWPLRMLVAATAVYSRRIYQVGLFARSADDGLISVSRVSDTPGPRGVGASCDPPGLLRGLFEDINASAQGDTP